MKAETKFTEGPWSIVFYVPKQRFDIMAWREKREESEAVGSIRSEANAHLIAAAPEMYEALGQFVDYFDDADEFADPRAALAHVLRLAKPALARAEGSR